MTAYDYAALGARLRQARSKAGLSGRAAGELAGCSQGAICSYEQADKPNGRRPTIGTVHKLAAIYRVPFVRLLTGEGTGGMDPIEPKLLTSFDAEPPTGTIVQAHGTKWVSLGPDRWVNAYEPSRTLPQPWAWVTVDGPVTICD